MTRIYVDLREIPAFEFTSLDEVLRHVEANMLPPASVIRDVRVDGRSMREPGSLEASATRHIADRERIEIFSANVREVAMDSLQEGGAYLLRVATAIPALASSFRADPETEEFEQLKQFYEGFYWLSLLLDRVQATFELPLAQVLVEGASIRDHLRDLSAVLKEIIGSHERANFMLLADLLERKLLPSLSTWSAVFENVARRIAAGT